MNARPLSLAVAAALAAALGAPTTVHAGPVPATAPHADGVSRPWPAVGHTEATAVRMATLPGSWMPAAAWRGQREWRSAVSLAGGRRLLAQAGALQPCPFDDGFLCGKITPPLERGNPAAGTIDVRFVVAPHTGTSPTPRGAIFTTSGGPGNAITGSNGEMYPFRDYVLAPLRARWDLVFVDQRGVGRSDALNCPGWQHDMSYGLAAQCARRYGDERNDYSSKAVADDTDDIRQALGYDQIVVMGGSYGGNDAVTYAMRHPGRTEAVVAGSPAMGTSPADPFAATTPESEPSVAARHCRRSVACAQRFPHPFAQIKWLIHRVRAAPVTGVGYDYDGQAHHVRITETVLAWWIMQDSDFPFPAAQIVQAAAALKLGDKTPLLRLAAQNDPQTASWDNGDDIRSYSNADNLFRFCTDHDFPWDENAARDVRYRQYRHAKAAQPWRYGMFRRNAWLAPFPLGFFPDPCIAARWKHQQAYPPDATVAGVPTLVLTGDYDLVTPTSYSAQVTELLTDSTLIEVKSAAHNPWWWRRCAVGIVQHFIRTADAVDSCAGKRAPASWTPGSFPRRVAQAPEAASRPGDESTAADRRLALVGAWSVMDTVDSMFRSGTLSGRGLRGGATSATFNGPPKPFVYRLHDVRFTQDVAVTGEAFWDWDNVLYGSIQVSRPHGKPVTLHLRGQLYSPAQRVIRVHANIGGRAVRVTVPAY